MKTICLLFLAVFATSAYSQEDLVVQSVREDSPNIDQAGKQTCVRAYDTLQEELSKINGVLFRMETHREMGYDIRHQDRTQIMSLIVAKTTNISEDIRKAGYAGRGDFCLAKMKEGIELGKKIYTVNIVYRKITKPD